jgi:hypothetical protein
MPQERKLLSLVAVVFVLFMNEAGFAHDGHENQDMIIPNLGNLGTVDFPVSCSEDAQKSINTGVGLLHHMMYAQAEKFFAAWIDKEPECAMMYWGYAMTLFHPLWPDTIKDEALTRGEAAIKKALTLNSTAREKHYINATAQYYDSWQTVADKTRINNWAKAQEGVYKLYPDEIDAAAFYALSQLCTASKQDPAFSQQKEAGSLLNKFYKTSPTHPGVVHYTIHAYDSAPLAVLAIDAARDYDQIAPDVPHALHMPSHIFVRLGMWTDVINWNIRSAKAALNYPTNGTTSMHYAHAVDYLVYGYLQLDNKSETLRVVEQMETHHPIQSTFPAAYALAAIPARLALEQEDWSQASQLKTQHPDYIAWQKFPQVEAITYYARGLGAARNGDMEAAKESVEILNALYEKTLLISPNYWALLVDAQRQVVSSWIGFGIGDKEKALVQLRHAADIEDSIDKDPVTPGAVLPARELLADMLVLNGNYSEALTAYEESLAINPNRFNSLTGADFASKQIK